MNLFAGHCPLPVFFSLFCLHLFLLSLSFSSFFPSSYRYNSFSFFLNFPLVIIFSFLLNSVIFLLRYVILPLSSIPLSHISCSCHSSLLSSLPISYLSVAHSLPPFIHRSRCLPPHTLAASRLKVLLIKLLKSPKHSITLDGFYLFASSYSRPPPSPLLPAVTSLSSLTPPPGLPPHPPSPPLALC